MPKTAVPSAIAVTRALERVLRQDRGRLMAVLMAWLGSFQVAEDALQEASLSALVHWVRTGLPDSPRAWLLKVARRKALDRLRSEGRSARRENALAQLQDFEIAPDVEAIPDERLRLIFICCHPALEEKTRVALTLRTVCGLSTREIARLFLDSETTLGQRLSRARTKIAAAGIPFATPEPDQWYERLQTVLTTIYLIFTTGYLLNENEPRDLCREAVFLARLLQTLCPHQPEVEGLLALILITDARRKARIGPDGASVPPGEQDSRQWDAECHQEGEEWLRRALDRRLAGPFQIKAAISACHMKRPVPDWPQILQLYTMLLMMEPTPVVKLNQAVALAETGKPAAALAILDTLKSNLQGYQPFYAARAAISVLNGDFQTAKADYQEAIKRVDNEADRKFLAKCLSLIS